MESQTHNAANLPALWTHKNPTSTRITEFKTLVEKKYNRDFQDYNALWEWSVVNLDAFWNEVWHFTGVQASRAFTKVGPD